MNVQGIMVQFLEGAVDFGAHPAADTLGTRGFFLGVKWPGHETSLHAPFNAGLRMMAGYLQSPPPMVFRGTVSFTFYHDIL